MEASTSGTEWRRYGKRSDKKQRTASEHSLKRLPRTQTQRSHSTESWRVNQRTPNDATTSKNNSKRFEEYKTEVICPFCLKIQKDSYDMVRHLDTKCRLRIKKEIPFTTFQILPPNEIKCNRCNVVLNSIETYFHHSKTHPWESENSEFIFCSSCKVHILDSHIHLKNHMEHEIHNSRRKSMMDSDYYLLRGITCTYCFYGEGKKFKCLTCPPPLFLFDTPLEIIQHVKTTRHIMFFKRECITLTIYCCFCDEVIVSSEIRFHFTTENHLEKVNRITGGRSFKLCFYCGFACKMLKELSDHMRSKCEEIKKIKAILGLGASEKVTTIQEVKTNKREFNKKKCILVEDDVDIAELIKVLKTFGKITYVDHYDDHRIVIEFKNEAIVETILLWSSFIKINGEKLKIQFFKEEDANELHQSSAVSSYNQRQHCATRGPRA